jgi:hypothetical protein
MQALSSQGDQAVAKAVENLLRGGIITFAQSLHQVVEGRIVRHGSARMPGAYQRTIHAIIKTNGNDRKRRGGDGSQTPDERLIIFSDLLAERRRKRHVLPRQADLDG